MENDSINDIIEMIKQFKMDTNGDNLQDHKDLSSIDFSGRYSPRSPLRDFNDYHNRPKLLTGLPLPSDPLQKANQKNDLTFCQKAAPLLNRDVFSRLYQESRSLQKRRCLLEYESKRSKEQKEQTECTFTPNISRTYQSVSPGKLQDSTENESFYMRNLQWQQRRDKAIRMKQCENNQGKLKNLALTFSPKINPQKPRIGKENKGASIKGFQAHMNRQSKAKENLEFIKRRKKVPYAHIWTVKKGFFSYVK